MWEWVYKKFWYLLPDWYWLVIFLAHGVVWPTIWKLGQKVIKIRLRRPHELRVVTLLVIILLSLGIFAPVVHLLFPKIVKGVVYDKNDSTIPIKQARVLIKSLEFDTEEKASSNSEGKFSVRFPRRYLGRANLEITDINQSYLPFVMDCNLKKKDFFPIGMTPRFPEYSINFHEPANYYIDSPGPLKVCAIFERKEKTGTVHIPCPIENVELLINEMTKEYKERNKPSTDRVTWREPLENYELKEHEVRVVTRYATAGGRKKEVLKKTYFTPVWHDKLVNLDRWLLPKTEKSDWQSTPDGIEGKLRPGDTGNLLWLDKDVPWGPIALGFDVKTLNHSFVNVVVTFGEHYRIIIGDGDLATVKIQGRKRVDKGKEIIWAPLDQRSYHLDVAINANQWVRVIIHFYPEFKQDTSRFLIQVLHPKNRPFLLEPIEVLFRCENILEDWHRIRIGHLNPTRKSKHYGKLSNVIFGHFKIYGPLRRSISHAGLHEK